MSMNPKYNNDDNDDDEWETVDLSTSNYGRQDGTTLRSLAQQPVEDDEWEAVDLSIAKRTPAKKEPGFFGGLATFAKRTGSVVADVVPKTIAETIRGGDESLQEGFLDKFIAEQKEDIQKSKRLSPEDRKKIWINTPFGPITHGHLEDAPDSLGYSIANALAAGGGYKAGAVAGTAIGGPGIGTAAGLLAGFIGGTAVSGRATKDQFVDDIKAKFSESVGGRVDEQTEQRWKQIYKEISSDANWYGFWEAAPETVGNMLTFGIAKYGGKLTKPLFAKIQNKIAKKVGSGAVKLAGMLTEEELTEAVTSMKQSQIEAEHGLRDKPLSFGEAAKEVWPTVALVTPIMGGGMQIASRKKPTARDILLDEDEKGATAKDILTKEEPPLESGPLPAPPVEEDLTGAESLEAEEAVAAVGEEALEEAAEVIPEKPAKQKGITKKAFDEAGEIITIEPEHKIKKEWDTTPADENEAWGLMMKHVESVRAGNKDAIDNLKDELESLKSSRNKEDVARKKEIRKEIDALKAQSDILEGRYENEAFEVGMAFVDKARDRAKKAGVPEDALDDFAEDFSMQISQERPYIERNYDRTLEQIFEETLKETEIDTQAQEAATSPDNEMPEPTEAQIEAGNYKKGHIKVQGFDISVENPEGSQRTGTSPDGKKWSITMSGHYGYFKRSEGKDGEQIDVFVNAGTRKKSDKAYIVDQVDPKTGRFDEHKVMMGYPSLEVAEKGYLANYEKGWKGLGNITEISIDELKGFVEKRQAKPYKPVFAEPTEIAEKLPERRIDIKRRKRISEMTEKEMKKELLINPVTKIPNKRAYQEKEQIDLEQGKISVKTYIDVDSLKYVNDLAGHVAGDELLKTIAKELESITPDESYHISGDEFIIRADTEENAKVLIDKLNEHLSKAEIEFTNEKGDKFTYKGLGISYGIHKEERRADELLREHKKRREAERIRAKRGERPPGLREVPPREDREREGKIVEEIIHEPSKPPKAKPPEAVREELKGEAILELGVEKAVESVLEPHGSVLSQIAHGKEKLIKTIENVRTITTKRGKEYRLDVYVYEMEDGRQRIALTAGDPTNLIDSAAIIKPVENGVVIESLHGGKTFEGLGGTLVRFIKKKYKNIIPDEKAPLSIAGKKAVSKLAKAEAIPEVKPKVEKETIPVDEAISLQKERINKANVIDKVFERMSLKSLIEFKELGKKEVPVEFFTEKEKEHKVWKPGDKISGIEKKVEAKKPFEPDFASMPLETIKVEISAIREKTGETVKIKEDAKVALEEVDSELSTLQKILECL